jgi:ankyrin repeat protein
MVGLLLARGADATATNDDGATVLSMAQESADAAVIARVRDALRDS